MWTRLRNKLSFLLRRNRFDDDMSEELEFHRAMLEHDKTRDGLDERAAGTAARRQLGNVLAAREGSRDAWVFAWFDAFLCDLRLVTRSLRHAKGFTAAAVITFALGIGVNVAVFTALDRLMFRPLPFAAPDRLVQIHAFTLKSSSPFAMVPTSLGAAVRDRTQTIEELAFARAHEEKKDIAGFGGRPVAIAAVSANLLRVLGIHPAVGRDFTPDQERPSKGPTEILLNNQTWRSYFGADNAVLDRIVGSGRERYRIVGVLPADFVLPSSLLTERTDALAVERNAFDAAAQAGEIQMAPFARLRPGVTAEQAQRELNSLIETADGSSKSKLTVTVQPLQRGLFFLHARFLWLVVAAAAVLLLVACLNLSTLLLARGRSRERDTVMRFALGASFGRIVGASVIESSILCMMSGVLALLVCSWAHKGIMLVVPPSFRGFAVTGLDMRLVVMTLGAALVSAIVAGLIPVLAAGRSDLLAVLGRAGRNAAARLRGGATLLAVEAALGVVLVAAGAATVPSFVQLVMKSPGFDAANLYELNLNGSDKDDQELNRYSSRRVRDVLEIVRAQPGVAAAGAVTQMPLGEFALPGNFWKTKGLEGGEWGASADVFKALGATVVHGRDFTAEDTDQRAPVAIVNQIAVKHLWPGADERSAIGRIVATAHGPYTVVGVVADIRSAPGEPARPALFVPVTSDEAPVTQSSIDVTVRMADGQEPNAALLSARLAERFEPRPVQVSRILDELIEPRLQRPRFLAVLFGALAAIALFLAAVGIYAVANFEMSRRRQEMAVRVALGATRRQISHLIFARVVRPVALGAVAGAAIAWAAAGVVQALVFEVNARAPVTLALVVLVIVSTAVLAGWWPARRASTVDPAAVLRES